MSTVVLLNTGSGTLSVPANREILLAALCDARLASNVVTVGKGGDIESALRPHVKGGCQTVVAAGGDGTVSAVAAMLIGTGINLGVIPGGTLNHFARDLNIPPDLTKAVHVIKTGVLKQVDVGAVNDHMFLNNAGLGLYPEMVMKREDIQRKGFRKASALFVASGLTLLRFPLLDVRLTVNGQAIQRLTPFVFVGNNSYEVEGIRVGVRSRIDMGQLCVWVARRNRRLSLVRAIFQIAFKGLGGVGELDVLTTTEATIQLRRKVVPVSIDGEVFELRTPLQFEVRPGALRVIVPAANEPE